jgi:tetratricopeptide (TPR) repeat protein
MWRHFCNVFCLLLLQVVFRPVQVYCESPTADASAALGRYYFENGKPEEARVQLEQAVRLRPAQPDYQAALAEVELSLGNAEAAIRYFEAALKLDPTRATARSKLAQLYWSLGRDKEVLRTLRVRNAPVPLRNLWQFTRGLSLFRLGRLQEARREFLPLVDHLEFAAPANFFLGRIAYAQNRFPEALRFFAKAVRKAQSQGLKSAGEYSYDYGLTLFRLGRYAEARIQFALSTSAHPLNPSPWMMRGRCEEEIGNFAAAITNYEESIRVDPKFERSYYHLARLHQRYGDRKRAAELFHKLEKRAHEGTQ